MRFIAVLRSSQSLGFPPPALLEGLAKLGAEAAAAGVLIDTAGLLPTDTATRVGVAGGDLTVDHGPFEEDAPLCAYSIYEAATREDVLGWTRRLLELHRRTWPGWEGQVEIRQAFGRQGPP
jgi:hypothetical protein